MSGEDIMETTIKQSKKNTGRAVVQVLLAGVGWGIIGLFTRRLAAAGLSPVQIAGVRAFVTSLFMVGFLLLRDPAALRIRLRDLWMFLGTGIASVLFFNVCSFMAIELTGLSVASILLYTAPAFVVVLSAILWREPVTKKKLTALVLTLVGCALVCGVFAGDLSISLGGVLLGLGAGFFYALYSVFGRYALAMASTSPVFTSMATTAPAVASLPSPSSPFSCSQRICSSIACCAAR